MLSGYLRSADRVIPDPSAPVQPQRLDFSVNQRKVGVLPVRARVFGMASESAVRCDNRLGEDEAEAAAFLEAVIQASPDIIYIYDRLEGRYSFVSSRCKDVLGFTSDQMQRLNAKDVELLIHPEDLELARAHYAKQAYLRDDEVAQTSYRVACSTGEYRLLRCRQMVFSRNLNGDAKRILGVATDLTDQANRERELKGLREQLLAVRDHERRRLALRLHDTAIQHLVGAALLLQGIERDWCKADSWQTGSGRDALNAVQTSLSRALREIVEPLVM
jgi:PAS domain S-box-containing protein